MSEHAQLTALCQRLGAEPPQAEIMAKQLIKRADQLVAERGLSRERALEHLLRILVEGRAGKAPEASEPSSSPPVI
jgi:hypothetical protein